MGHSNINTPYFCSKHYQSISGLSLSTEQHQLKRREDITRRLFHSKIELFVCLYRNFFKSVYIYITCSLHNALQNIWVFSFAKNFGHRLRSRNICLYMYFPAMYLFWGLAPASESEILLKEGRYIRLSNHHVIKCVNPETLFQLAKVVGMIRFSNGSF